jgi:hypothetical protein
MNAYARAPLPIVIAKEKNKDSDDLIRLRSKHSSGMTASTSLFVGYRFCVVSPEAASWSRPSDDGSSSRAQILGTTVLCRGEK